MAYLAELADLITAELRAKRMSPDVVVYSSRGGKVVARLLPELATSTRLFAVNAFQGDEAMPQLAAGEKVPHPLMLVSGLPRQGAHGLKAATGRPHVTGGHVSKPYARGDEL